MEVKDGERFVTPIVMATVNVSAPPSPSLTRKVAAWEPDCVKFGVHVKRRVVGLNCALEGNDVAS